MLEQPFPQQPSGSLLGVDETQGGQCFVLEQERSELCCVLGWKLQQGQEHVLGQRVWVLQVQEHVSLEQSHVQGLLEALALMRLLLQGLRQPLLGVCSSQAVLCLLLLLWVFVTLSLL